MSSPIICQFPKGVPIKFGLHSQTRTPGENVIYPDEANYINTYLPGQYCPPYEQKQIFTDTVHIMVLTQRDSIPGLVPKLYICDHNKVRIATIDLNIAPVYKGMQALANDVLNMPDGTQYLLWRTLWAFRWDDFFTDQVTDSGIYYLQLDNKNRYGSTHQLWDSEPIFLYPSHPETVLLSYYDDTNNAPHNMIVDGWDLGYRPGFDLRVEGRLTNPEVSSINIGYNQQQYLRLQNNAQNRRAYKFNLGGRTGAPAYMLEKAAEAFAYDNVYINGKVFIADVDAENPSNIWKVNANSSTLLWAELPVRERYDNQNAYVSPSTGYELIFTSPGSYPYAFSGATMSWGSAFFNLPPMVFYNSGDESDFLAYLNSTLYRSSWGISGSFTLVLQEWNYINSVGAHYAVDNSVYTPFVMTRYFNATIIPPPLAPPGLRFIEVAGITSAPASRIIVDFGQNTPIHSVLGGTDDIQLVYPASQVTTQHVTTTYAPGTFEMYIFHDDRETKLLFALTNGYLIDATTGSLPLALDTLQFNHGASSAPVANIDITALVNLADFRWYDAVTQDFAAPRLFAGDNSFLLDVRLDRNKLTVVAVDKIFNDLVANSPGVTVFSVLTRTIDTSGQIPAAPPTGVSLAARNALLAAGWTVIHD